VEVVKVDIFFCGSGKTTIANALASHFDAEVIKIAAPIYELQAQFYKKLGVHINSQDGELLQYYASKIEQESPGWLAKEFLTRVSKSRKKIIFNDDCRLNAYRHLKSQGIVFIRIITTSETRLNRLHCDHIVLDPNHETEQGFERIECQYKIDNNGSLAMTVRNAKDLISIQIHKCCMGLT